ncbi:HIT domain-containing protein [Candidatus Parvarchaeota archaeon]|nr:HIT domain-containing protein [Candidatus Parvarchaeota archaeon]
MECVFCESSVNELKFYESRLFIGVYSLKPLVPGHSLVIPKRHVTSLLDLDSQEKQEIINFMDRCVFIALKFAEANEFDIILQEGKNAGQSIRHLHFHIIPRRHDDKISKAKAEWLYEFNKREHEAKTLQKGEIKQIMERLSEIVDTYKLQIDGIN